MSWRAPLGVGIAALCIVGTSVDAQSSAVVRRPGPGPVGAYLATILAGPHRLITPGASNALLPRDSVYPTTVVLGRTAVIEGRVRGDVVVVGGDAHVHPFAHVEGRVVAIGGGAYGSRLAIVRDGLDSHRDFTFDVSPAGGGYALDYRVSRGPPSPMLSLPGIYGVRLPAYDRSEGLSLPFAALIALDTGRIEIEPTITYRSHIGAVDPSITGRMEMASTAYAMIFAGRNTYTNESWIWSDLVNSASVLGLGNDTRNYYRSDRIEATVHRLWQTATTELVPFVGARVERDREIGPDSFAVSSPWSAFGRGSREEILRPNPPVARGTLRSALLGARLSWEAQRLRATVLLSNEAAQFSGGNRFVQSTLDGEVRFPTFNAQMFWVSLHAVHTFGDTAVPQRWSYLGGSGTIRTLDLLSMGGDRLLYVESNYFIPIQRFDFRFVGTPSVTLRHNIGSAGVGRLPALEQNVGFRIALSFLRLELAHDPARQKTLFSAGLAFTR